MKPLYILISAIIIALLLIVIYLEVNNANAQTVVSGDKVAVYYTGTLTNGTVFDSNVGEAPLNFTVGSGQVITGFDQGVIGMKVNQTKTITIPANDAYGEVNPNLIVNVPLKEFANQTVTVGMSVTETASGQDLHGTVTAVNPPNATVDFNSPLAGQTLIFKITLVSIQSGTNQS